MEGSAALRDGGGAPVSETDAIRHVVAARIAPEVERIDREGFYPRDGLLALGAAGAYSAHLAKHTALKQRSLAAAIVAMAKVGETCMSTAFCVWCQDTCGWYLENTPNRTLRDSMQPGIASGVVVGGTGLSNPVKALAGIEDFRLRGTRVEGGWSVTGVLPWVSNLGDGHWFGTIFEDAEHDGHRVMAMFRCGEGGVDIRQNAHFVALEGTGTYSARFRRVFAPDAQVLADPIEAVLPKIRPGSSCFRPAWAFGVTAAVVAQMRRDNTTHGHSNCFLPTGADEIEEAAVELQETVTDLADHPGEGRDYLRAVLEARLAVSELTLAATQAGVLHAGAKGYLEGSGVARRQREGNFVAIITPSIRQLRQEISELSSH